MQYSLTTATKKVAGMSKRIRAIPGGTAASKTISILMYLIHRAQSDPKGKATLTSVVAESIPHLKRGAMRDFKNILKGHNYWNDDRWNATDSTYTFETGSQIEFFSSDSGDKLRGARRDRLFVNEANNVAFEAFEQLEVRTKEFVYLDWNPSSEFWYYSDVKTTRNDVEEMTLTYKDNEALSKEIVAAIEQRKSRKAWWQVYGEGKLGEVESRIFKGWEIIDGVPEEARLIRRGLDFGYTNDPTAIVEVYEYNGGYVVNEITYRKGLSNKAIADILLGETDNSLVVADSAEPKSIDEIRSYGVNIIATKKGKDSVRQGIQFIQDQKMCVTKGSVNLLKEYRNYLWMTDRDGRILNEPEDCYNHGMDALRYAFTTVDVIAKKRTTLAEYDASVNDFLLGTKNLY